MSEAQPKSPPDSLAELELGAEAIVNALPQAVLAVAADDGIRFVNQAAEHFFAAGRATLCSRGIGDLFAFDSPVVTLIAQVRERGLSVVEYGLDLNLPRLGTRPVDVQMQPLAEDPDTVLIAIQERTIAQTMDRQLNHRGAARSIVAMAAVLAHEVKNPLSGIRGAAQLLEQGAAEEDRNLTRLICDETDRICALVDRMEMFSDDRPIERGPVNIHEVLNHVRDLAASGFAAGIRIIENFDPSLPLVLGNRDLLIQALINLVKNAAEAAPSGNAEIILGTAYRQGVWVAVPGSRDRLNLPLEVSIQDNGEGIAEELRPHLFEAFVSSRATGTGLGLALVAKIVRDHGGLIEFQSQPRRTVFRLNLPVMADSRGAEENHG
jgi:two-component system nitrogen regulation sensor histidine kinase GlnL